MNLKNIIDAHYRQFEQIKVSPDGKHALVVMGNIDMPEQEYAYELRNRSIWKCSLDQSGPELELASPAEDANSPSWSHDGNHIVYISRKSGRPELWLMNHDGTGKRQLTQSDYPAINPYSDTDIVWSKSGKYCFFTVAPNGSQYEILTKKRKMIRVIKICG